jgi:glycerol-3-phosphate O-acyltransferase
MGADQPMPVPKPATVQDRQSDTTPTWPNPNGQPLVFLIDASSRFERQLLEDWIDRHRPNGETTTGAEAIPITPSRGWRGRTDARLEARLSTGDNPLMAPLRVAWLPPKRNGIRAVRFRDLASGDPREPGPLRQHWIWRRHPDRCRIVAGEPASASELRDRWRRAAGTDAAHTLGLAEFVTRQALLALERSERRLRGARYKVPRFVHEDIFSRAAFRGGIAQLSRELGKPERRVLGQGWRYLREIAATHSPYVIDLVARGIHLLYTRGYGEALHYDRDQIKSIFALSQRCPIVFLPSHKSNLDHLVLQYAIHENGHPPNHTAGGINMNFFPVGPIVRRSGVFFIRRTFKDNPTYKFVLRQYVDYLIEKRFSLEWYVEGGRSRSGKLLPPRLGMLAYVVDAFRRGKSDDVYLVPVSIAYDQIEDIGDYVAEQRGAAKETESFGWFIRVVRKLQRRYGDIHIRFGDPISLAATLGPPKPEPGTAPQEDERSLTLQKLAFEVCVRINRVTPITPTSLVTLALLGVGDRALSIDETVASLRNLVGYVRKRRLPTTVELELDTPAGVRRALDSLVESGVVSCFADGPEAVYAIGPGQHLTAAYYRNTVIHFFVNGAIGELALLRASDPGVTDPQTEFWDEAMRLRDLLKFEFFFAEKEEFRRELREELALQDATWEADLARGSEAIHQLLRRIRPYSAHRILRPFLESYRVVGDALSQETGTVDEGVFLAKCLAWGKQYRLQHRIRNGDSVSRVLFATAFRLARNRGLVQADAPDLETRRKAWAQEIREAIRRVDMIGALASTRFAGLIE